MKGKLLVIFSIIVFCLEFLHAMSEEPSSEKISWNGKEYKQLSELTFESGLLLLEQLMPYTGCISQANGTVLEIGCGLGRLAVHMAKEVFPFGHVTAVDNNQSMLNEAKKNKRAHKVKNITLTKENAYNLTYDQTFDLALAVHFIQWIQSLDNIVAIMKVAAKSLKPSGLFGAIFSIKHTEEHPIPAERAIQEVMERRNRKYFRNHFDLSDYNRALEQAGFIGEAKILKRTYNRYISKEKFIQGLKGLPFFKVIHPDEINDFCNDLLTQFNQAGLKNKNGKYQVGWDIGIIIARKTQP